MNSQISQIVLKSKQPTFDNIYFKFEAGSAYFSRVSRNDMIDEVVNMSFGSTDRIIFQIWKYHPQMLVTSWTFEAEVFYSSKSSYRIVEDQWNIVFYLNQPNANLFENKENMKVINSLSRVKELRVSEKKLKKNVSISKEINNNLLNKKQGKVGIKKALKTTIDFLMKQQSKAKSIEDYGFERATYAKTGKCTPSLEQTSGVKNHSSLFSEYGFDHHEFMRKYEDREQNVENVQCESLTKVERKKKIKIR